MSKRTKSRIESISGIGKVFDGEQEISTVNYQIYIDQYVDHILTTDGYDRVSGAKQIHGRLQVIEGERNLAGNGLTLELSDGRKWEFSVKSQNPFAGHVEVLNRSSKGIIPQ